MPFLTDDEVLGKIQARLINADAGEISMTGGWPSIARDANQKAQNEIFGRLAGRGYTPAQIAAWDRAGEFNGDLALFWAFTEGGIGKQYDDYEAIDKLDRSKELAAVDVLIGGRLVLPGAGPKAGASIAGGSLSCKDDVFRMPRHRRYCGW